MQRNILLQRSSESILSIQKSKPTLVAIDGVDASGKTYFADELAEVMRQIKTREIIRASIDGFHNPRAFRYQKGKDSPEGYYSDSFDLVALQHFLLRPLSSGNLKYRKKVFDYHIDQEVSEGSLLASNNAILIMDGVILQKPELRPYWDIVLFLDVDFEHTLPRAITRDGGNYEAVKRSYEQRYIPGQKLYFERAQPKEQADIVIDNTDFKNPSVLIDAHNLL